MKASDILVMSVVYEHLIKGIYRDISSQNMFCSPPTDCKLELEINKEFRDNFQKIFFFSFFLFYYF